MTTDEQTQRADADGGWKDVIEDFTEEFFEFYFPKVHAAIDFTVSPRFLDTQLRELVVDAEAAGREADRLIEARLKDGTTEWLLVHVEVQGYPDPGFAERMFIYNYRIFDKYHRDVVSLAVLTDNDPSFRPSEYRREKLGCCQTFSFPIVKLIDYSTETLEDSDSVFALITRVQLAYLEARRDDRRRFDRKVALTHELVHSGYDHEKVLRVFRFLDFVMRLPKPLAIQYRQKLESMEGELQMPYVTSIERLAKEEGQLESRREDVIEALEIRFGDIPYTLCEAINHVSTESELRKLHRLAITVERLDKFTV
ncbi:MAG: hypothetical protein HN742_18400 [Lentisphaerae bacterium]|nr:hypothetical protein [Lentisphaerota bacterium]MBT4822979.1 hypothetical protein [Lentisphaerota bacterium]MBT5606796.1 hypothetical protein [Lentisphaerota bacterium]MBT7061592.1 hypothetical protein [Lentisphaerota bacterium]MBT7843857.1 hypothetical protein [Lentisphaerota bacterium]